MNESSNILTWFEIAVTDLDRAQDFYQSVFEIKMRRIFEGTDEAALFPGDPQVIQATSGRVSGCLVKKRGVAPSHDGVLVYLNAYPDIDSVMERIRKHGGTIVKEKAREFFGYYAVFLDPEGNRVAIHSES